MPLPLLQKSPMAQTSPDLLTTLLKQVSRSFYLTLRVLPTVIRPQIGLAYLLARAADTLADTEAVPVEMRLKALQSLRERILGQTTLPLDFGQILRFPPNDLGRVAAADKDPDAPAPAIGAERILLERIEEGLFLLKQVSSADRKLIREVLQTITSGQILDLTRFGSATATHIVTLQSEEELDDYTYRVAGCVGEFWTRMCRAHIFPNAPLDDATLLANGIRFGKGLQLVNILRDLAVDLRQGRCYLPAEQWQRFGVAPAFVFERANDPAVRRLYDCYLAQAADHLRAGWAYTNALPHRCARVRLACAWPILIGVRTLEKLRRGNALDPQHRIKIERSEVRKLLIRSVLYYPWPRAWNRLFLGASARRSGG